MKLPLWCSDARRVVAAGLACGALLLPSCRIPDLRPAAPAAPLPDGFGGPSASDKPAEPADAPAPESSACLRVDEFFNDPVLTHLIVQAVGGNQQLKILGEDVQVAAFEILARRGALLPLVRGRVTAGLDKSSRFNRDGAVDEQLEILPGQRFPKPLADYLVAADISWQIDIWRKLRNARDAAALRFLATGEGRNYAVTRLVADVADNYFGLLALDKRLETLDRTIALQEQSLVVAKAKKEAGRGTELAVQRFLAEVRKNQGEKSVVRQEIVETENRINFLLGRFPQPVERVSGDFIELSVPVLSAGVPAQLLLNRPDIRQAERELEAAGLEVKVARAEFFPSLDIDATVGYRAFKPQYLFNPEAFFANLAGNLVTPLINKAAIRAAFSTANARQLQSLYEYQRTVLEAFTEVVNRFAQEKNYRESLALRKQQLQALEASVSAAGQLFQNARAEYSEVLFAQRDLQDARLTLIDAKRQQLSAVVNAYQALGGGDLLSVPPGRPPQIQSLVATPAFAGPSKPTLPAPTLVGDTGSPFVGPPKP